MRSQRPTSNPFPLRRRLSRQEDPSRRRQRLVRDPIQLRQA